MTEQLQLFFQNVEKIRLYFGSESTPFEKELALKLTVRNIPFYYEDYEKVVQQVKAHTKWYSSARVGQTIYHNYYVHFAKTPDQIQHTLHMYKQLTKHFKRNEQTYLAAMYMKQEADIKRLQALIRELAQLPSLSYATLKLSTTALLLARENDVTTLAQTYERYYEKLLAYGYEQVDTTKMSALLLTFGTGIYCDETSDHIQLISHTIRKSNGKLERCHYNTIALLALAKFDLAQFPALYAIHDEICRELNIKRYDCNSLLLATQIYTSNEPIGDLPEDELNFCDMLHIDSETIGDDCANDEVGECL